MSSKINVSLGLGLIFSIGFHSSALIANADKGKGKEIKLQWNGSGCAKSETTTAWDPMVVQIVASREVAGEFQVKRGAGASPRDARKNCDLIVSSAEPLQFAVERIEIKGSGALPADAKVDMAVQFSSQGDKDTKRHDLSRADAKDSKFSLKKDFDEKDLTWSACGRALLVSTSQAIKSGVMVNSKFDSLNFNLQAKSCKP